MTMKETKLWNQLRPLLSTYGKFQKISDRFTGGIPDVLGSASGRAIAAELKELDGVLTIGTRFRPGQLDFLRDWERAGGCSLILSTHGVRSSFRLYIHPWQAGVELERGVTPYRLVELSLRTYQVGERGFDWPETVEDIVKRFMTKTKISL